MSKFLARSALIRLPTRIVRRRKQKEKGKRPKRLREREAATEGELQSEQLERSAALRTAGGALRVLTTPATRRAEKSARRLDGRRLPIRINIDKFVLRK